MAIYYVGPQSAGAADGSSWEDRYGSLNDAEDTPVAAGDTVIVGPGVYREQLTVDISGGAGNEIEYIADVTGAETDGIGGVVRITGSDNDQTATRARCIRSAVIRNYRIFRGFSLDTTVNQLVLPASGTTNWTLEDCTFQNGANTSEIVLFGASSDFTFRRCRFLFGLQEYITFSPSVATNDGNHLIENCIFAGVAGAGGGGIVSNDMGGITIRNCTFTGVFAVIRVFALTGGAPVAVTVNNCVFAGNEAACWATNLGDLVENFNAFSGNRFDRINVAVGGGSVSYPPLFLPDILYSGVGQVSGIRFPPPVSGQLSEWSEMRALTGTSEPTEDLLGIARPVTASENSWGAIQFHNAEFETTEVFSGRASRKMAGPGRMQVWRLVTGAAITVSVRVMRDSAYVGLLPQMIVKQPGQADQTLIDTGAAEQWNRLAVTFTPSSAPPYVVIELVSRDTSGSGVVYWDALGR